MSKRGPKIPEITPEMRARVESLASFGTPQEEIAKYLGFGSINTLYKYFRNELDFASTKANAMVGQSLFRMAVGAPAEYNAAGRLIREEQKPLFAAAAFWMKTRAGWREVTRVEMGGDPQNGEPIKVVITEIEGKL